MNMYNVYKGHTCVRGVQRTSVVGLDNQTAPQLRHVDEQARSMILLWQQAGYTCMHAAFQD